MELDGPFIYDPSTFVACPSGGGSLKSNGCQKTGRNKNGSILMGVILMIGISIGMGRYHQSDSFISENVPVNCCSRSKLKI